MKRISFSELVVFATIAVFARAGRADTLPQTGDRPGRVVATDVANMSDDDLLNKTAETIGVEPPGGLPIDKKLLTWFGYRQPLEDKTGFSVSGYWTLDESKNFQGGDSRNDVFRDLFDLRMNLDTATAFNWKGGTFSFDFQNQAGRNGSDALGDVQGYDNADSDGRTQINEFWYEQLLFDNRLRLKGGKIDANSEFAFPENGTNLLNSSFGHSPTIVGMPTYPDPSTGLIAFVYPTQWLYGGFGAFDGSAAEGTATGDYGPARLNHGSRNYFYIGEVGVRWMLGEQTLPGKLAVGGHYLDADLDTFAGGKQSGVGGEYLNIDQKIWHKKFYDKGNADGVYVFGQYGHTDKNVNEVEDYFAAGVSWVGPYEKADPDLSDTVGAGVAAAHLSDSPGAGFDKEVETSVELFYNWQVKSYFAVKPDLQYINHPGGGDDKDALVATVRLTLAF